jgi:hypothetical protein
MKDIYWTGTYTNANKLDLPFPFSGYLTGDEWGAIVDLAALRL